jgi:hypothetical protein
MADSAGLLPPEHFGGRPGRSCEDAVAFVVDAVHDKWREGDYVAAVLLDVKGTFPSINRNCLLSNLRRRGVPPEAITFISSFLDDRSVCILLRGVTSASMSAAGCGLPQGSPLSPILYLFYNSNLFASLRSPNSLSVGWIDDCMALVWVKMEELVAE